MSKKYSSKHICRTFTKSTFLCEEKTANIMAQLSRQKFDIFIMN